MVEEFEGQDIDAAERGAREKLDPELREHLNTCGTAFNLINLLLGAIPRPFPDTAAASMRVGIVLLQRLANDLRATEAVASLGYPAQASGLVASMYETAHAIGYIGNSEHLADQWWNYAYPTKPFRDAATLTVEALKRLGVKNPEAVAERHYKRYTQLCWSKHVWPQLEMTLAIHDQAGTQVSDYGPNTTDVAVRTLWFALEQAVWCACQGINSMIQFHLNATPPPRIWDQLKRLVVDFRGMHDSYNKRWPNTDPFPGKWKKFTLSSSRPRSKGHRRG